MITSHQDSQTLSEIEARADELALKKDAANTRRAYRADLADFEAFCAQHGLCPLPAEPATVKLYITVLGDRCKFATIRRRMVSINRAHEQRGLAKVTSHPLVRDQLKAASRAMGTAPKQKSALTEDLLREALATLDGSLRGARDKAILLLGFAGGFRRSELAGLRVADLKFVRRGLEVELRRSKTDQEGKGRRIGIPTVPIASLCAVRAVREWMERAQIVDGYVFRTIVDRKPTPERIADVAVARIVQRATKAAGIEGDFGGHSLRAGFVTSADSNGASASAIMTVTGHKSRMMVDRYARRANIFDDSPLLKIFR